jgi:formyltetrahydrofolate deformylase
MDSPSAAADLRPAPASAAAPNALMVLTLSCPDRMGIVAAVSNFLLAHQCNIFDSAQFGDRGNGTFFMRISFTAERSGTTRDSLAREFEPIAQSFAMRWELHDTSDKPRVLILVSRFGHCLNDLLYRHRIGALAMDIPAIASNHRDFYQLAAAHDVPFHHLPVDSRTKIKQETRLLELIESERIDLVVLARYMQVLSADLCRQLAGRAINIHHSFLPSFKGAKPYQQAHQRGVKLVGATAHYITPDLDEGPIIEQDVIRVDQRHVGGRFRGHGP